MGSLRNPQNLKPKKALTRHLFLMTCRWSSSPATE